MDSIVEQAGKMAESDLKHRLRGLRAQSQRHSEKESETPRTKTSERHWLRNRHVVNGLRPNFRRC
jgi:hypothetical protein